MSVAISRNFGGESVGKAFGNGKIHRNGHPRARELSLWRISRCHSVDKPRKLSTSSCGGWAENDLFHIFCGKPREVFQTFPRGFWADYPVSVWKFGDFDKLFRFSLCKTSPFPHCFPQAVENGAGIRRRGRISCGKEVGEVGLFHTDRGTTRISFL
jgi:hypothetical protein